VSARLAGLYAIFLIAAPLSAQYDLVVLNGHVMDPASGRDGMANVGVTGGRIAAITTRAITGKDTIDATGLIIAPGFIDIHDHGQDNEIVLG